MFLFFQIIVCVVIALTVDIPLFYSLSFQAISAKFLNTMNIETFER